MDSGAPRCRAAAGRILPAVVLEPAQGSPRNRPAVFIHGWPDSPALWRSQMEALSLRGHRCVSIALPGYPPDGACRSESANEWLKDTPTFDSAVADVAATMRAHVGEDGEAELICHDWGCVIGYRVQKRFPELVARMVALDVGNDVKGLTTRELAFIVTYQAWLTAAFILGGRVGDGMTTWFAKFSQAPSLNPGGLDALPDGGWRRVPASRNWPYLRFWQEQWVSLRRRRTNGENTDRASGTREAPNDNKIGQEKTKERCERDTRGRVPSCPLLYMYGTAKPARFHGDRWIRDVLNGGESNRVVAVEGAGHWFLVTHAGEVNDALLQWLDDTANLSSTPQQRSRL